MVPEFSGPCVVLRESRAGEARVALAPEGVAALRQRGVAVRVEAGAGEGAGFPDSDYAAAGATVVPGPALSGSADACREAALHTLLTGAKLVLRVKRAERNREILEARALASEEALMLGFLDPLESERPHVQEWASIPGLTTLSLDCIGLPDEDPRSAIARMSRLTGPLALDDALRRRADAGLPTAGVGVAILGPGACGISAAEHARKLGLTDVRVFGRRAEQREAVEAVGAAFVQMPSPEAEAAAFLRGELGAAVVVIASARSVGKPAPKLIDAETLRVLPKGTVIIDLALTEGGNVEGSRNDTQLDFDGVIVANVTGYPKRAPREASMAFSDCMQAIIASLTVPSFAVEGPLRRGLVTERGNVLIGS